MLRNERACAQLDKIVSQWQISICRIIWYKIPKKSSRQRSAPRIDLGPLLFILYINDMNQCSYLEMVQYADDSTVYDFGSDILVLTNKLNFEIQKVDEWLRSNKFSLNITNSFFSFFQTWKMTLCLTLVLEGETFLWFIILNF